MSLTNFHQSFDYFPQQDRSHPNILVNLNEISLPDEYKIQVSNDTLFLACYSQYTLHKAYCLRCLSFLNDIYNYYQIQIDL